MIKAATIVLLFAAPLHAAETAFNAASMNMLKVSDLSGAAIVTPTASAPAALKGPMGEVVTQLYLMPNASKNVLTSFVKSDKEFADFTANWNQILQKNGFTIGEVSYRPDLRMAMIHYSSPRGLVLRRFLAENLTYDALNPTAMHNLRQELTSGLARNGLYVAASFYIKSELFRPTCVLYYITAANENEEREAQLRIYQPNVGDIDYALFQANGVNIIRRDSLSKMVYIGRELGFHAELAVDEIWAASQLEQYKKQLSADKMVFIASSLRKLEKPLQSGGQTYNYALSVHYYK